MTDSDLYYETTMCTNCQNVFDCSWVDWKGCPLCGERRGQTVEDNITRVGWRCACGFVDILVPVNHIQVGYAPAINNQTEYVFHAASDCKTYSIHTA